MKKLLYYPFFWWGYKKFLSTGSTPRLGYISFRQLFGLTNGGFNERISKKIAKQQGKYELKELSGMLGNLSKQDLANIVEEVRTNGFYRVPELFPAEKCDEIRDFALKTKAETKPVAVGHEYELFDENDPKSTIYRYKEEDMLQSPLAREIMMDETWFALSQEYIGSKPLSSAVGMWWSTPTKEADSTAAQLYHFDMDRLKFLQLFIYLEDVGPDNGPHCFVRKSNRPEHRHFTEDRRFSDEEIAANYPAEDVVEVTGKKGTILVADTSGLHKGKVLKSGRRIIFQLVNSNSLFGQGYDVVDARKCFTPEQISKMKEREYYYQRFLRK